MCSSDLLLPKMIERAGVGRNGHGSVTAIYTVLMEGDDTVDPIVDIARASLDGQVMLSRKLADAAHYPAIDLSGSISRIMPAICDREMLAAANRFRRWWTLFQQNQDLINVGAYQRGANVDLDEAISRRPEMEHRVVPTPEGRPLIDRRKEPRRPVALAIDGRRHDAIRGVDLPDERALRAAEIEPQNGEFQYALGTTLLVVILSIYIALDAEAIRAFENTEDLFAGEAS